MASKIERRRLSLVGIVKRPGATISPDELDTVVELITDSTTGGIGRAQQQLTEPQRLHLTAVLKPLAEVIERGKCFAFVAKVVGFVLSINEPPSHRVLSTMLANAVPGGFDDDVLDALRGAAAGLGAGAEVLDAAVKLAKAATEQVTAQNAAAKCAALAPLLDGDAEAAEAAAAAAPAAAAANAMVAAMAAAAVPLAVAAAPLAVAATAGVSPRKVISPRKVKPKQPRPARTPTKKLLRAAGSPSLLRAAGSPPGRSPGRSPLMKKGKQKQKPQAGSAKKVKPQAAASAPLADAFRMFLEQPFPVMSAEAVATMEAIEQRQVPYAMVLKANLKQLAAEGVVEARAVLARGAAAAGRAAAAPAPAPPTAEQRLRLASLRDMLDGMDVPRQHADEALAALWSRQGADFELNAVLDEVNRAQKTRDLPGGDSESGSGSESGSESGCAVRGQLDFFKEEEEQQQEEEEAFGEFGEFGELLPASLEAALAESDEEEGEEEEEQEEDGGGGAAAGARAAAAAAARRTRRAALHAALYTAFLERLPDGAAATVAAYCAARQDPALHVLVRAVMAAGRAANQNGDHFPDAPISGELTGASLVVLMAICLVHCGATPASLFCDAGAGRGMALLAAALLLGCPTCGIEVHALRVKISVRCISAGWAKFAALVGGGAALPPATRFFLSRADLAACPTLGADGVGATIVYCFDTGMPYAVVLAIARAINATATVTWMLSFQDMVTAGLLAEEVTSLATPVRMHGSGSGKTCRFFRMQQPRRGATAAARANDDSFTLDGAGRVTQVSGVDLTTNGW